jgi:hypothetical protein
MALDRQMAALRARHAREINRLYKEFAKHHPSVETGVIGVDLTPAQADEWHQLSASMIAVHRRERSELAAELRVKTGRHHVIRAV